MHESSSAATLVAPRDNTKLGFWLFIGSEVVFFSALILTLTLDRMTHPTLFSHFRSDLSVPIIAVNTFVLISSSYVVVRALEAIRAGRQANLRRDLLGVIGLGLLFLAGQAFEWITLFGAGESFKSPIGTAFFTVTGIHGSHVFVGVVWCLLLFILAGRGVFSRSSHSAIELFGLYWHFVDIVWIVLFTLIYLV